VILNGRIARLRQNGPPRKLAAWLKKGGHRPMLVSVDVYRPARARAAQDRRPNPCETKLYEGDLKMIQPIRRW